MKRICVHLRAGVQAESRQVLSLEVFRLAPLPIWVNDETGNMESVASADEILKKNPNAFDAFDAARKKDPSIDENLMVHRPWIDDVTWQNEGESGTYRRVPEGWMRSSFSINGAYTKASGVY